MPGREDFAIIRARLLADPRAHHAAALYAERGLAVYSTALATVVGHVGMLGLYASRETDDGQIPATAVPVATMSFGCPPDVARTITESLTEAGLLRERPDSSLYVVGFADCYAPIIAKRERDRERKAAKRADTSSGRPTDVPRTSRRTGPDQTGPEQAERARAGASPLHPGQRLTARAWASVDAILDCLCRGEAGQVAQESALNLRRLRKAGALGDEAGAELLDRYKSRFAKSVGKAKQAVG